MMATVNSQISNNKDVMFSEFVQKINDKVNNLKLSYVMNDNLDGFMDKFGILYLSLSQ